MTEHSQTVPGTAQWGERFRAYLAPRGPRWRPAAELFGDGLEDALGAVAEQRAVPNLAVAGSLLFEQYVQRLVPPVLALHVEGGRVLDARLPLISALVDDVRIAAIGFPDAGEPVDDREQERVAERLFAENIDVVVTAIRAVAGTPRRVLHGAVAHAATTAFLALSWARPDPSHHLPTALEFLRRHDLADLVRVDALPAAGRHWLYAERRSCCLAFRAAAPGRVGRPVCATCPIATESDRHASFAQAAEAYTRRPDGPG